MRKSGFRSPLPPAVAEHFDRLSKGFSTSLLCEDAFQRCRLREGGHRGGNKRVSDQHLWSTVHERKVVDGCHHYSALAPSQGLGSRPQLDPELFGRSMANAPKELRGVVGRVQKARWYSPSAANLVQPVADLAFCEWMESRGSWDKLEDGWLSELASGGNMLLRRKGSETWFFSMGCSTSVVLMWPAERMQIPVLGPPAFVYRPVQVAGCINRADACGIHIESLVNLERGGGISAIGTGGSPGQQWVYAEFGAR